MTGIHPATSPGNFAALPRQRSFSMPESLQGRFNLFPTAIANRRLIRSGAPLVRLITELPQHVDVLQIPHDVLGWSMNDRVIRAEDSVHAGWPWILEALA